MSSIVRIRQRYKEITGNANANDVPVYEMQKVIRAYKKGRADLLKSIRESAKHLGYDDIEDLLSYVAEKEQENE